MSTIPAPAVPRASASRGSGWIARIVTGLLGLVLTPISLLLISWGGSAWQNHVLRNPWAFSVSEFLALPRAWLYVAVLAAGLLLLAAVVLSGPMSSAGLLAGGATGLISLLFLAVPALTFALARVLPGTWSLAAATSLSHGLPLSVGMLLGGMGIALVLARRGSRTHVALRLVGVLLVPLVLLVAAALLSQGLAMGPMLALRTFDASFRVLPLLLILAGAVLLVSAAAVTRWSPFALLLPALALLLLSASMLLPATIMPLTSLAARLEAGAIPMYATLGGAGLALAVVMAAHTLVIAVVRRGTARAEAARS